jgi:hypothetical protein
MPLVVKEVSRSSVTQTGTLTSGSAVVTGLSDTSLIAGAVGVSGTGLPRRTYVTTVDSSSQITLTSPATASGSVSLTFAIEPVTIGEAKKQLRIDFNDDDADIAWRITSARRLCETMAKSVFVNGTFDVIDDAFPFTSGYFNRAVRQFYGQFNGGGGGVYPGVLATNSGVITLPRSPLVSVTSITYLDVSGVSQVLSPSTYAVASGSPGRVSPTPGNIWPVTLPEIGAITIRIVAGYGPTEDSVPDNAREAILLTVANSYIERSPIVDLPTGVLRLLGCEEWGGYA